MALYLQVETSRRPASMVFCESVEPVAQLVEHRTFNAVVAGSSPARLTIFLASVFRNLANFKRLRSKYVPVLLGNHAVSSSRFGLACADDDEREAANICVIPVTGRLVKRGGMNAASGMTSYRALQVQTSATVAVGEGMYSTWTPSAARLPVEEIYQCPCMPLSETFIARSTRSLRLRPRHNPRDGELHPGNFLACRLNSRSGENRAARFFGGCRLPALPLRA